MHGCGRDSKDDIRESNSVQQSESDATPQERKKKKVNFFPIMPLWVKTDRLFLFALTFTAFAMITRD